MSRTHRVSLIPNGHSVWTIQIEYGISTILYGSYNPFQKDEKFMRKRRTTKIRHYGTSDSLIIRI